MSVKARSSVDAVSSWWRNCCTSPMTTPEPSSAVPAVGWTRPRIMLISVLLPAPFRPTIAIRSPYSINKLNGPKRNESRSTTASVRRATIWPDRSAAGMVRRSSHGSRGDSTTSRRSIARWV